MVKIQINLSNRWLYTLISVGVIILLGVVVYAVAGVSHSSTEITEADPTVTASVKDGVSFVELLSKPLALANMVSGRIRMYEIGCGSGWASSCDANSNGNLDTSDSATYATSAGSATTATTATTANSVSWQGVTNKASGGHCTVNADCSLSNSIFVEESCSEQTSSWCEKGHCHTIIELSGMACE